MTHEESIAQHNENGKKLAESYEKSAAHAALMMHLAEFSRDRTTWRRRRQRYLRCAKEARATISHTAA